jgi:hypothetical protein
MDVPPAPRPSFIRSLHARGLLLPILLVIIVGGLLVQGALSRRPGAASRGDAAATPTPSPSATPFRPELEKIPLSYFSDYWLQLATRTQRGLVTLGQAGVPGVRVRPGLALTTIDAADVVSAEGANPAEGRLVAADAHEGLALFALGTEAQGPPLPLAEGLHAGNWLAAVTLDPERGLQIVPGHLVSTGSDGGEDLDVSMDLPPSLALAAVVDLDGALAGIAARYRGRVRVLSAVAAGALANRQAAAPVCRGLRVAPLPRPVRSALGLQTGVLVDVAWPEAFPTAPNLRSGDVLLQWNRKDVGSPDAFAAVYDDLEPGASVTFVAVRGGRRISGQAEMPGRDGRPSGMTPREIPGLGAIGQWIPARADGRHRAPGVRLLRVLEGTPAARAGLEAGDLLLAVDSRPLTWPEARRFLTTTPRGEGARVLTILRQGTIRLAALPGTPQE